MLINFGQTKNISTCITTFKIFNCLDGGLHPIKKPNYFLVIAIGGVYIRALASAPTRLCRIIITVKKTFIQLFANLAILFGFYMLTNLKNTTIQYKPFGFATKTSKKITIIDAGSCTGFTVLRSFKIKQLFVSFRRALFVISPGPLCHSSSLRLLNALFTHWVS